MDANGLLFKDEAYAIVGAAMEVHNQLGPGFLEAVYADALSLELAERGIPFEREVEVPIHYKGRLLPRRYRADFVAHGGIILELKALRSVGDNERAQALNYLKATDHSLALLLNFGAKPLDWIRLVHTS